jgi:hypothetical protein
MSRLKMQEKAASIGPDLRPINRTSGTMDFLVAGRGEFHVGLYEADPQASEAAPGRYHVSGRHCGCRFDVSSFGCASLTFG